jgi:RimJ/RimL family protein N-acetyltransferase
LIESENVRSIRVAEKLGMNYEKTMIFKSAFLSSSVAMADSNINPRF